jgi:hypothetical protein
LIISFSHPTETSFDAPIDPKQMTRINELGTSNRRSPAVIGLHRRPAESAAESGLDLVKTNRGR